MARRSSDLNSSDFFLWEYLKEKVFDPQTKSLDDLKTSIADRDQKDKI